MRCRVHNRWQAEQDFGPWPDPQSACESSPSYGAPASEGILAHPVPEQVRRRAVTSVRVRTGARFEVTFTGS
jgi:hypothetical protein